MDKAFIVSILIITIRAGTSLLYATLGEIFTERVGILNLGVEGIMIMGAATSFSAAYYANNPWIGLFAAIIVGCFFWLFFGSNPRIFDSNFACRPGC
jgi:simple sugar transport system permease protein